MKDLKNKLFKIDWSTPLTTGWDFFYDNAGAFYFQHGRVEDASFSVGEAKAKAKEIRMAHRETITQQYKSRRKRERKCFWTRPFGHEYANRQHCVGCGKLFDTRQPVL